MNRLCIILAALALTACAGDPQPAPQPQVITVDVPRIVQRACPDTRQPRDHKELPVDPEDLAMIPAGDYEALGRVYRAAVDMMRAWLALDEVQIKGCAAEP